MAFPRRTLASSADASLSDLRIWPAADRDSALGEPPGAGVLAVELDRWRPRVGAIRAAVRARSARRTAVHGHTAHTVAAARDTARRARAGTPLTRSPMPPISGHGAPDVMKVTASDTISEPLKARSWRSGLSLFRRDSPSTLTRRLGPRSSPVNGERRRSPPRGLHRSTAGSGAHRQRVSRDSGEGAKPPGAGC